MEQCYTENFRLAPSFYLNSLHLYTGKPVACITIWYNPQIYSPQKVRLCDISIINSNMCGECNTVDTIEHYEFTCKLVKPFWLEIKTIVDLSCGPN